MQKHFCSYRSRRADFYIIFRTALVFREATEVALDILDSIDLTKITEWDEMMIAGGVIMILFGLVSFEIGIAILAVGVLLHLVEEGYFG